MKRHVLIYGIIGGVLVAILQWTQYRFLVIEHSAEIYGALIAAIFAGLGIWLGLRFKSARERIQERVPERVPDQAQDRIVVREVEVPVAPAAALFAPDDRKREDLNITRRELEILELVAQGLSNREIAAKLFVSENTVKTHCSRAFDKLGAKRRTQAVQLGKEFGLIP
jgi:NarL family two-component system response regulator LiaR